MKFHRPPSGRVFGKVTRPVPQNLRKLVIRGMSFLIYRLAKNQAKRGDNERGFAQIIIT